MKRYLIISALLVSALLGSCCVALAQTSDFAKYARQLRENELLEVKPKASASPSPSRSAAHPSSKPRPEEHKTKLLEPLDSDSAEGYLRVEHTSWVKGGFGVVADLYPDRGNDVEMKIQYHPEYFAPILQARWSFSRSSASG